MSKDLSWPVATFQAHRWHQSLREYSTAVLPSIAALDPSDFLTVELAERLGAAQQRLIDFDASVSKQLPTTPNGTTAAVLLRSEAVSSSRIENLTVSARQLALAEMGQARSANAKFVAANVSALNAAETLVTALNTESLIKVHRALTDESDIKPGLREELVWIGTTSSSPLGADYVAPAPDLVPGELDDLWEFLNRKPSLPLGRIAVSHAQFESIHPFVDGNGRVGRALVQALLKRFGLSDRGIAPISAGLLTDPRGYVKALIAFRNGDIAPIIEQFISATYNAVDIGTELLERLQTIRSGWQSRLTSRKDSAVWKILDILLNTPAITVSSLKDRLQVSDEATRQAVRALSEAGILKRDSARNRDQIWVAPEITEALDRVAVSVKRRRPY
jgi:Fic family protein